MTLRVRKPAAVPGLRVVLRRMCRVGREIARDGYWTIRRATLADKRAILKIAHQHSSELGYVHPVALSERIQRGTVLIAERSGSVLGFVDYHQPTRGDNKGYSVVYHLAVDKRYLRRGIGRALLFAVPCPIRLKCTQDNERANEFYKHAGMMPYRTEPGSKRPLNVWQLNVLFIQVAGDNQRYADAARSAGIAYGCRHDDPPKDYPFMFDIKWDDYDWQHYLSLLKRWRPVLAMVADYERPEQRDLMLSQVEDLRALGIPRIMACAKFEGAVAHLPVDCIVAISVPAPTYAGFVASDLHEYAGRKIHLLGGSPQRQRDLMLRLNAVGARVISMDGNTHTHEKKSNQVFVGGTFAKLKPFEKVDYYKQIEISGRNIAAYMNASAVWQQHGLFTLEDDSQDYGAECEKADTQPRLLDLFCGAGGAARGYQMAGFHVTGVDIKFQPRYAGDVFIQADALDYLAKHGHEYDVIHASPPCQRFSVITKDAYRDNHPDLIAPTRELLKQTGKPFVIENVPGARRKLINPIKLCGSMFRLMVFRHRYFEFGNGFDIDDFAIPPCRHDFKPVYLTGSTGNSKTPKGFGLRKDAPAQAKRDASGIAWMVTDELDEAIPPAFTEFIGKHLMAALAGQKAATA